MAGNFDIQSLVKQITNTIHPELMLPEDTESPVAERMVRLVGLLKELEEKLSGVDADLKALRNNVLGLSDDLKKIEAVSDEDIQKAADKAAAAESEEAEGAEEGSEEAAADEEKAEESEEKADDKEEEKK